MTELLTNAALNTANAAIETNPDKILADKVLGAVDPSLQKQFDQTVNANNLLGQSGIVTAANNDATAVNANNAAAAANPNLGWVNGFRAWLAGQNVGLTYKEEYLDPITSSITNNRAVDMSEAIVKNAITDAAQSAAETMGVVVQNVNGEYEKLLDLDPKVLDKRLDELNNLLKDKTVQKDIGVAASSVAAAAQEPLEQAQHQLVEISAKMVEDVGEQGALALGNALKVLPVVGNVLSALGAFQNLTDVVATTAKGAKEALNVAGDLTTGVQLNLKAEAVKTLLTDPSKQFELGAAYDALTNTTNDLKKAEMQKIEELKTKVDSNSVSSSDKNDASVKMSKSQSKIQEYDAKLGELMNDPNVKAQLDAALKVYKEHRDALFKAQTLDRANLVAAAPLGMGSGELAGAVYGGGGTKSRKRRAHANKQTLKRISDCLKQHFSKTRCATRKSHTKKKRKDMKHMKRVIK